jgi:hypothetical protein
MDLTMNIKLVETDVDQVPDPGSLKVGSGSGQK